MKLSPLVVSRRNRRTRRPELVAAPGPAQLAQPGAGTFSELYGHAWALGLHRDGPRLYQRAGDGWSERHDPAALVGLVRGVRWVGLAFDQAARPVICWEQSGAVYVRQWDALGAQYVTRGPWAGCDPVLMCDAPAHLNTADSDVTLYHLDAARAAVVARTQRDLYGVPRTLGALTPGAVLDQAVCLPYGVQLLGEDAGGPVALVSEPLPVALGDRATGAQQFGGGDVFRVLYDLPQQHAMTGAQAWAGGALVASLYPMSRTEAASMTGALLTGDLSVVLVARTAQDAARMTGALLTGDLSVVLVARTAQDAATAQNTFTGGTYA